MPNLTLTHSGNMNIANAYIAGNSLKVDYNKNNTGAVIGFTFTPEEGTEFVCGETYTIIAYPKYIGTVLSETFTVSGVDGGGVSRSDTSVLRQDYDRDLTHYPISIAGVGITVSSSAVTSGYASFDVTVDELDYAELDIEVETGVIITYPITNIIDPTPDTGSVATALTIVVADTITDSGQASATYSPSDANVNLTYTSSDTSKATINPNTGAITVLASGSVSFCVYDSISQLQDCKTVTVSQGEGPDTGVVISSLTINVPQTIINSGFVSSQYSPSDAAVDLHYSSNLPAGASINETTGEVTVYESGNVTFCVRDSISNLSDCKSCNVINTTPTTYITALTLNVPSVIVGSGIASASYSPLDATTDIVFSSADPNVATIDPRTGIITVITAGTVNICAMDLLTSISDCKTVEVYTGTPPEYLSQYLTFEILIGGRILWMYSGSRQQYKTISYSINNGPWTTITSTTAGTPLDFSTGDIVRFKGENTAYGSFRDGNNHLWQSYSSLKFKAYGNIMSMLYGDNFYNQTILPSDYALSGIFSNCFGLTDASNLVLPATTLTERCYDGMFTQCTSLTQTPVLPATTLARWCYEGMFNGCTSLTTTPVLPVTTLAVGCYGGMFQNCTSLTQAPELPATTLADSCYWVMFRGCTGLTSAPELPATTLAGGCYEKMFQNCTSLTSAPTLPVTTLASSCYFGMFWGCTGLTSAPVLPATTLVSDCYRLMFNGCTSLATAPELPATSLADGCYLGMFSGCTNLNYIICLATNISATNCTGGWVSGVASSGLFVKNPSMSSWTTGNNGIPSGWTITDAT